MNGLSRFHCYPRDWISGTRTLSAAARGVYWDLCCAMYDRGGPLKYDEKWLCRFLGFRDRRQLKPVLRELHEQGKIQYRNGHLYNDRTMREIEEAHRHLANGAKGGRPRAAPTGGNAQQKPTSEAPARHQRARCAPSDDPTFEQNQGASRNPPKPKPIYTPPSPPSGGEEGKRARKSGLPPDFVITQPLLEWFNANCLADGIDLKLETDEFREWALSTGAKRIDWPATWRKWMVKAIKIRRERGAARATKAPPGTHYERRPDGSRVLHSNAAI